MAVTTLFRIFYNAFFTILNIILLALVLVIPSDAIRQALDNKQLYNVFVIAGSYFVTAVLAILIYLSRLYTTRQVLSGIPKTWIPIEEGDVSKSVRKMIEESLVKSAIIAWNARPRVPSDRSNKPPEPDTTKLLSTEPKTGSLALKYQKLMRKTKPVEKKAGMCILPRQIPVWGDISHPGWSSPTSPDLPNLHYKPVILELPHLIEAKAVSLSPPTSESLEILSRPASMGLRDYLQRLLELAVLDANTPYASFLNGYEVARFSTQPLSELQFRDLMRLFAEVLRGIVPFDSLRLYNSGAESDTESVSSSSKTSTARSRSFASLRTASSPSDSGSVKRRSTNHTYPTTPRIQTGKEVVERSPSFSQSRRPYPVSQSSSGSLRSQASLDLQGSSMCQGSVI
jgi:hypothetical protein